MTVLFRTKKGAYGFTWQFTFKDIDYSSYTAKIYVWDALSESIVDGEACTVTKSDYDTVVSYVVQLTDFSTTTMDSYNAEIEFNGMGFQERSETFKISIESTHPTVVTPP